MRFPPTPLRATIILAAAVAAACSAGGTADSSPSTPITPPPPPPTPVLALSVDSLVASAISGAARIAQDVDVTAGSSAPVAGLSVVDVAVGTGQPGDWISTSLSAPVAPAKLTIGLAPTALPPGKYDATVRLGATGAVAKSVRVALTVRPRPHLTLDKTTFDFAAALGGTVPLQTIAVSSVDGSIDSLSVSKLDCGTGAPNWLTPTLSATSAPTTIKLAVAPGTLAAGTYNCSFVVSTAQTLVDSASQGVRVSLKLKAEPRIVVSTDTVRSLAIRGGAAGPAVVSITNGGSGILGGLSIGAIAYGAGSNWLTATLDSSTAPTTLTLKATAAFLPAGFYTALVPIYSTAEDVVNSPRTLPFTMTVQPLPSSLVLTPAQATVTRKRGVAGPATFSFSVTASGDTPLSNLTFTYPSTGLPAFPMTYAMTCQGAGFAVPCRVDVTVDVSGSLAVGTYGNSISIKAFNSGQTATMYVTLAITP